MLASLPMYDFPEAREATDAFWAALAKACNVSITLTRGDDWTATWNSPDLLFSQTCGYPFTHAYKDMLKYVTTPHYDADGCSGHDYRSIVFAREGLPFEAPDLESLRGSTAAYNNSDSMSGMLALQLVFAPLATHGGFFGRAVETGGHLASLATVQAGRADVCAIDCVTVAYARRYRPSVLEGLVEVQRSPLVPGLPFVTRSGNVEQLREAVASVMADPGLADVRDALLLTGVSLADYRRIPALEQAMQELGGLTDIPLH